MSTPQDLQEQVNSLAQSCLALTAQLLATQAVLCSLLPPDVPPVVGLQRLQAALLKTGLERGIGAQHKMLGEATPEDLAKAVTGMTLGLKQMVGP
jgi:hypothetical protein